MGNTQSRILRATSIFELLAAVGLAWWLASYGVVWWLATLMGALLPVAVHGIPLGLEFIVAGLLDPPRVKRLSPPQLLQIWVQETWNSFVLFTLDQPWRADFPEPKIVSHPSRVAVLLVHGYMCNRATWRRWLPALSRRWNVSTVNLEPVFGPIERYAPLLEEAIQKLRRASGAERVTLVCHSMGGLAASAYLSQYGADAVQRVITIGTPHHGTRLAIFGQGACVRQMRINSEYLKHLSGQNLKTEYCCFASHHDNLIIPRSSQVLDGCETLWFDRIGHLSMVRNAHVLGRLVEVVERPPNPMSPPAEFLEHQ